MTEQQLIIEAKKGSTNCFTQLVGLYQLRLYSYLLARCERSHDADDVLQETIINAYKYIQSYDSQWKFSTWLFTIARRILSKLKPFQHLSYDASNHDQQIEHDPFEIDKSNIWLLIKNELKSDEYDALWFFYNDQSSIRDIAKIMEKTESWVKTSLRRSKIKLSNNSSLELMLKTN